MHHPQTISIPQTSQNIKKTFYKEIITRIIENPSCESKWKAILKNESINFCEIYKNLVCNIKDKKIAEFNFKCLHRILPYNKNLFAWGLVNSNKCPWCDETETLEHLLFTCNSLKTLWEKFTFVFKINFSIESLLFTSYSNDLNWMLSLFKYIIFKRKILKINNKNICDNLTSFLKLELGYKHDAYFINKYYNICEYIKNTITLVINAIDM
jgi:hypothetical protein